MLSTQRLKPEEYEWIGAPQHVVRWLREGVKIPFWKKPNKMFYVNRIDTKRKERFMDEQVSKLAQEGTIRKVNEKPTCVLAMQCVPKKQANLRLVMDCRPVNYFIKTPKFTQEGISAVAELIEGDDDLITIDLKNGFYHVPIFREHQTFIGFKWRGCYYVWNFLPFGISCAPFFFNKVVRPVIQFLRNNKIHVAPFVDDFLIMLKRWLATDHIDFVIHTFQDLGWQINWGKSDLTPAKEKIFVGFNVSTYNNEPWIKVLPAKIRKLRRTIGRCLNKTTVTARELARIIGQCVAMTKAVIPGKLLLHNCYRTLSTKKDWNSTVTIDVYVKKDLIWWMDALKSWNGTPLCQKSVQAQIETDASSVGWGCLYKNLEASGTWNKIVGFRHSNYRELLAIYMALQTFRKQLAGLHVQVLSDNITSVAYINRLGGSSRDLSDLMTTIWTCAQESGITLSARYLAGKLNTTADRLSRIENPYNWKLNKKVFKVLDAMWGPHTVDRFAAQHNAQLIRYNSLYWDPNTEAVDALSQTDWSQEMNYCAPPFWMINKVLDKVIQQEAEAMIIAPIWTGQRWFQKLQRLTLCQPIMLRNNRRMFIKRGNNPEPCKNYKWRIAAWRISGKW